MSSPEYYQGLAKKILDGYTNLPPTTDLIDVVGALHASRDKTKSGMNPPVEWDNFMRSLDPDEAWAFLNMLSSVHRYLAYDRKLGEKVKLGELKNISIEELIGIFSDEQKAQFMYSIINN